MLFVRFVRSGTRVRRAADDEVAAPADEPEEDERTVELPKAFEAHVSPSGVDLDAVRRARLRVRVGGRPIAGVRD